MLVEDALPGVAAGEVVLGRSPEPGPQRDQEGDPHDPGDDGEPAVPEAGAPERADDPGAGRLGDGVAVEGGRARHVGLLRAGGVGAPRYSSPAAARASSAGRQLRTRGLPWEYSGGSRTC